jgi:hypothetical protein
VIGCRAGLAAERHPAIGRHPDDPCDAVAAGSSSSPSSSLDARAIATSVAISAGQRALTCSTGALAAWRSPGLPDAAHCGSSGGRIGALSVMLAPFRKR